jgi:hypothetical protein
MSYHVFSAHMIRKMIILFYYIICFIFGKFISYVSCTLNIDMIRYVLYLNEKIIFGKQIQFL